MTDQDGMTPGEHLVAQGAIMMQYENAEMRAVARAHKRNEQEVKDRALAILENDADAVASAFYSIPYKEHTREGDCNGRADDSCPSRHVEGLGIDGCSELARLWGNNSTKVYFDHEDDERVWLQGVFTDLETNRRIELPYGVSKLGVRRGGSGVYTLNPTRLGMAIQAGVSKAARNAIAQGLPRSLRRAYFDKAKELLESSAAIKIPQLLAAFEAFEVTREMLEGLHGAKLEELTPEQRKKLRGLFVAIREGLVDPKQHFQGTGGVGGGATDGTGATPHSNGVTPAPSAPSGTAEVRGGTEAAPPAPAPAPAPAPEAEPPAASPAPEAPAPASTPPPAPTTEPTTAPAAAPGGGEQPHLHAVPDPAPAPAPSQPTREGVQSPSPNDDDTEPGQPDLKGLGI